VRAAAAEGEASQDIVAASERGERAHELEGAGHAQPRDAMGGLAGDGMAAKGDRAGVRPQHTRQEVEHGRLARAVGSQEADDLTRRDREAERIDGQKPAEAAAEAGDLEQRAHAGFLTAPSTRPAMPRGMR
jgi:hypothetical protein